MTPIDTTAIKANHSVSILFERDGHVLKRSGDHFMCLCPFHREKTPSCHVWSDHFNCFGCNQRGDAIEYLRKTRSIGFVEAVRFLGGSVPIPAPSHVQRPTKTETIADFSHDSIRWLGVTSEFQMMDLAAKLDVSSEALWWLGAGWAEEHRAWSFPMHDGVGRVIGIRLRNALGEKWAVKGSKQGLFIPSIQPDKRMFICEGPTDTAACLTLGFYAIGRPSCNGAVDHVKTFIRKHPKIREVVLVTDNDEPGIKGADALREQLTVLSWQLILPPKDIRKYVQMGGGREIIEAMIHAQMPLRPSNTR